MNNFEKIEKIIACPQCEHLLDIHNNFVSCAVCKKKYKKTKNSYIFFSPPTNTEYSSDNFVYKIKTIFKKYPTLYSYLAYFLGGPPVNQSAKKFLKGIPNSKIIINLGSGTKNLSNDIINVDIAEYKGVSVVADASQLPFLDESIDVIICDYLLEHVRNPDSVVKEIYRVLKKDGIIYIGVPFIIHFHSAPNDFYRWTKNGLRELLKSFSEIELKVAYGPGSALSAIFAEWLATFLSFGVRPLYNTILPIGLILGIPLRILDIFMAKYTTSENIALGFYFIGKK